MAKDGWKDFAIAAGFRGLRASGIHRLAGGALRGVGAILMFHHVRPAAGGVVAMNRGLSLTPEFFARTLDFVRELGFDLVSMDDAAAAIEAGDRERPFAAVTFDDGYRDNLVWAEPILRAHAAPYAIFIAEGFADGDVRAWWEDLELAAERSPRLVLGAGPGALNLACGAPAEKNAAARLLAARLRALPGAEARAEAAALLAASGVDVHKRDDAFMTWDEIRSLAASPLCTIGAHTCGHERLASLPVAAAEREMRQSKARLEAELGRAIRHFAYPYGGPDAAGPREFALAAKIGFATAVTTRPGMVFPDHSAHFHALPRLSVNGGWQDTAALEALLSGLPFALWNRGKRLNVA
jgi:peptidoglycan/xylan/chitin deacetylase (PgdA/CDA1 family)